jgi:hypothetical protein
MTQPYSLYRDDIVFLQEHSGSKGKPKVEKFT